MSEENVIPQIKEENLVSLDEINNPNMLIRVLELITGEQERFTENYRLEGTESPLRDIIKRWMETSRGGYTRPTGSVLDYGGSGLTDVLENTAKTGYWIAKKIGVKRQLSLIDKVKEIFGTDKKKYKNMSLNEMVSLQIGNTDELRRILDSSLELTRKCHSDIYNWHEKLLGDKRDGINYLKQIEKLNDYMGKVGEKALEISCKDEEEKTTIHLLFVKSKKLKTGSLDPVMDRCQHAITWADRMNSPMERFEKMIDMYLRFINNIAIEMGNLLTLLKKTNQLLAQFQQTGEVTKSLLQGLNSMFQGIFTQIGEFSRNTNEICNQYQNLEKLDIPQFLFSALQKPVDDLIVMNRRFTEKNRPKIFSFLRSTN